MKPARSWRTQRKSDFVGMISEFPRADMNVYFYLIIIFYVSSFIWEQVLSHLNRTRMNPLMPQELEGIYDPSEYARQQAYQRENDRFGTITDGFLFALSLAVLLYGGLGWLDGLLREYVGQPLLLTLAFFGALSVLLWLINIPFELYDTFVIEEKFGFNKTTPQTFAADQIKSFALSMVLQGVLLAILFAAYTYFGAWFWLPAWALISAFSLLLVFFYSEWIVPLFNRQTPLEEGELRSAIEGFAEKVSFPIHNIYVMDGSKRTTKSNAYFTGFGRKKRIVLYDNLIEELGTEEIVAVLAHEIGHYKKKHIAYHLTMSLLSTGFMLWLLSIFLENPAIAHALGGAAPSLHLGLAGFALLYTPISEVLSLAASCVSRRNEYEADSFTAAHQLGDALVSALKKISSKALSNLTPHPLVVFWKYSHPTLLQRMQNMQDIKKTQKQTAA